MLDMNYLAWRAFYSTGTLSHGGQSTGVIFGVLRDLLEFKDTHNTKNFVFCFDYGKLLRERDYPEYKAPRRQKEKELDPEKLEAIIHLRQQLKLLRTEVLHDLGFKNVCYAKGYEADDIIASVCLSSIPIQDEVIIIGSDHDLYQLLSPRVMLWNPTTKKAVTEDSFSKEYGITPTQFIDVKAIAGCSGDNVIGIKGIGEKTAAKFLAGKLKATSATFDKIIQGNKVWRQNKCLVRLPYPGCPVFELEESWIKKQAWKEICDRLGMKSLKGEL